MSTRLFPPSSLISPPTPIECDAGVTMWRWIESVRSLPGQTLRLCALVTLNSRSPTVTTQGLSTTFSCNCFFATLCCIGVYNLFTMYYVGLRLENWETRCGYVYEVTIRLKDHADQLWCVVPRPLSSTLDQHWFEHWHWFTVLYMLGRL